MVCNFRFPGQYYDQETGLHYNYHRYYDPNTGRYLTPDPIGLDGGINLFLYSRNNPINKIDIYGLMVEADPFSNIDVSLTKGQIISLAKIGIGSAAIISGALTSETLVGGLLIAGGIVQLSEGLTTAYIEWGLHGDTSDVPAFWWEMIYKIVKGSPSQNILKHKSLEYDCE